MADYDSLFADLASIGYVVHSLGQTHDNKWEAQLHCEHQGRMIDRFCQGPTPFAALVNCVSVIEWAKANPPTPLSRHGAKGSTEELLSLLNL